MGFGDGKMTQNGPTWVTESPTLGLFWPQNVPPARHLPYKVRRMHCARTAGGFVTILVRFVPFLA